MHLNPDLWLQRPGLPALLATLDGNAGATRLVGGAVRDWLLRVPVADIDLATKLPPDAVLARLEHAGIKAIPTGLQHGTITAVTHADRYEITTLRRDVETFGRHATVAFTDDWREDAARRDFTINALYADPATGSVADFFDGETDLGSRTLRFIGDPLQRIAEDHLRILRFFRFSARFSDKLEPLGLAACAARANDLMTLSRERIRDELLKLLALPSPVGTVRAMQAHGILQPVLPELLPGADALLAELIGAELRAGAAADAIRRLAAMLPVDPAGADGLARRLRLSNSERERLVAAADRASVPADPRALAYAIGAEAALDRMLLTGDSRAAQWRGALQSWQKPRLPISGKDLIAMGLPPGPQVSRRLGEVEQQWVAAGFPASRESAMALAREVLGVR